MSEPELGAGTNVRVWKARGPADIRDAAELFRAYGSSLDTDLEYQRFSSEVAGLPGAYAPPPGELFLGADAHGTAGCAALRAHRYGEIAEMKRLFVLPRARGMGLGRALAEAVIAEARRLGYAEVRLDTLSSMGRARAVYEELGFKPIGAYYEPTPCGTIFMALRL